MVQLGGDLDRELHFGPGCLHCGTLGNRADEIAAQSKERLDLAAEDALAGLNRVQPFLSWGLEPELLCELVERHQFRLLGNADGSLALYIGMAPHGRQTGAVSADIAFEQKHIQQHRDIVEAMNVLCPSHAVDA